MMDSRDGAVTKDAGSVSIVHHGFDHGSWHFNWVCEKWSEEAVEFVRRRLERDGISHIQDGNIAVETGEMTWDNITQDNVPRVIVKPRMIPIEAGITSELLRKFVGEAEEVVEIADNLLVNEGIQRMLDLLIAAVSNQTAANAYGNTNAYVGVGDSTTAEAASQTELQAATNRFYKIMVATYPIRTAQSVDFRSDFTTTEANYAWQEWTVSAGATTASGAGFTSGTTNLNRKVQSLGTKTTGTWTMTGTVTIS